MNTVNTVLELISNDIDRKASAQALQDAARNEYLEQCAQVRPVIELTVKLLAANLCGLRNGSVSMDGTEASKFYSLIVQESRKHMHNGGLEAEAAYSRSLPASCRGEFNLLERVAEDVLGDMFSWGGFRRYMGRRTSVCGMHVTSPVDVYNYCAQCCSIESRGPHCGECGSKLSVA